MKNLLSRVKEVPNRSILVILMILVTTFGLAVSEAATMCFLSVILFPWCFCSIGRKCVEEGFEKDATMKWVYAYLLLYGLSVLVTMTAGAGWAMLGQSVLISSFFFLNVPKKHTVGDVRREILLLGCLMICLYLPLELLALLSVFTGKVFRLPLFAGVVGISSVGSVADRIRIFGNTNTVAIIAAMNVLFSVYAFCAVKRKWARVFFIFAIAVNYITLAHTQSRTSGIAFSVAIAAFAFRGAYLRMAQNKLRWVVGAVAAAAAFFLVLNGINVIYKADVSIASQLTAEDTEAIDETTEMVSRIERAGQFNVNSSGRGDIWMSTLKYLKNHPETLILGNGQVSSIRLVGEEYPEITKYINIHNSYLAAVFHCGLPFLICVLGFLCTLVPPAIRMLLHAENGEERGNFMIPVMVGMLLIIGIGEELLFIKMSSPNFLFYLFSGYLLKLGVNKRV